MNKWSLNSWKNYPAKHLPEYQDVKELDLVLSKIKKYPPLVFAGETRSLKKSLADVVEGKAFLLQGGDCAESFAEFHPDNIRDTLKVSLIFSGWNSAKLSAQSPPCSKKAFPSTTSAKDFFKDLVSPANTKGGYFFILLKTKSNSFLS